MVELYKHSHFTTEGRQQLAIGFPHHQTYAALRESATTGGCGACALFYEASNADHRYPNKPGIGEEDAVRLFVLSGDGYFRRFDTGGGRETVVVTGLKVSSNRSVLMYWREVFSGRLLGLDRCKLDRLERIWCHTIRVLTYGLTQVSPPSPSDHLLR